MSRTGEILQQQVQSVLVYSLVPQVVMDAILRLIPGVIGNDNSIEEETFENGLLEYPQYTKPQVWDKKSVPDVLLSGDHAKIKDWRLSQSEAITRDRRPDLWQRYKKYKKD